MAAPQGFEPRYADPESAVLPLNEGATRTKKAYLAAALAGETESPALKANVFIIRANFWSVKPPGQFGGRQIASRCG